MASKCMKTIPTGMDIDGVSRNRKEMRVIYKSMVNVLTVIVIEYPWNNTSTQNFVIICDMWIDTDVIEKIRGLCVNAEFINKFHWPPVAPAGSYCKFPGPCVRKLTRYWSTDHVRIIAQALIPWFSISFSSQPWLQIGKITLNIFSRSLPLLWAPKTTDNVMYMLTSLFHRTKRPASQR